MESLISLHALSGLIIIYFSVKEIDNNYKETSGYGKSALIGFLGIGIMLLIIGAIYLMK